MSDYELYLRQIERLTDKLVEATEALESIRDEPEIESNYRLPSERMRDTARAALVRIHRP